MSALHVPQLIAKKRDGEALDEAEIRFLVDGFAAGEIPDYQMAAWAMAVYLRGMDEREATALTLAMAESGATVSFEGVSGTIVDKHSTGGVGDKVSLVLVPLVAAAGCRVAKLSGRGLGHTGGTIDKLESIPGFRAALSIEEMVRQANEVGIAMSESTHDLAPADRALYALRDVTATVGSLPLIASSIMSKKLAVDSRAIVLDVKVGSGALMKSVDRARELARLMVGIGRGAGRRTSALLSDMSQPLGWAVGNSLEVDEAVRTLRGEGPPDLTQLCLALAAELVSGVEPAPAPEAADRLSERLRDGSALSKFKDWIAAQGGDVRFVDDPGRFPAAAERVAVDAPHGGVVARVDALAIGRAAHLLGAGRARKGDRIDHAVGVVLQAKVGDPVERGQPLATLHANGGDGLREARRAVESAFALSDQAVAPPALVLDTISP